MSTKKAAIKAAHTRGMGRLKKLNQKNAIKNLYSSSLKNYY